jgi:predicted NBD/HSP70 family sugar kinase
MTDLRVGIDIGGSKMLALAIDGERQIHTQITTGKDFTVANAQTEIDRFVRTLPSVPRSIGIAIPGLIDRHSPPVPFVPKLGNLLKSLGWGWYRPVDELLSALLIDLGFS